MIQSVIEISSFLFRVILRMPGGAGTIFMGALLLVFRWMLRDKNDNVRTATHSWNTTHHPAEL
jgi:hypothetical protein